MNKLIKKILLFLFPIFLIFIGFEIFYRFVPNDYSVKYATIPKKYNTTEVLIFGNSHTFYGLNPQYISKPTYNMAQISQTIYFDKILFDKYIDKFKKIQCVIIHIEYTSLSEIVETKENSWRKYYYQSYMNLDVPSIKKYDFTKYFLSSTKNFNANTKLLLKYLKEKTITNCDKNGFGINYTKEKKTPILKNTALTRVKNIEDNLIDFKDNIDRIQSMINVCKKRKIKVILLNMPVTNYFSEGVNQIKLKKIQNTCKIIAKKNDNVSYLNLFKDKRFSNEDFYNADHLHSDGATKCTKIVNYYINQIFKKNRK